MVYLSKLVCTLVMCSVLPTTTTAAPPLHFKLRPGNHAYLIGTVNTQSVNQVIDTMTEITSSHLILYLNSPGGLVEDGDKLISYLKYRQGTGTNITCIAEMAHSMAFHIMQHCHLRLVTPSAKMMQHQVSLGLHGELSKVNSYLSMINQISHRLTKESSYRIGMSVEHFQQKIMSDWWLSGTDIVTANVADAVALVGCHASTKANTVNLPVFECPLTVVPKLPTVTAL